ncbi:LPXTG cell wall anchor domain-containing protein [Nocardiopsis lucentensis]|uniref:LPXTG cell wall anchor domain-containing protein n=1 Tax=Nocardiopsis lucentensis TaxID=53441 RepID=UPI00037F0B11|nr:LPXTG cell wall anchor domain-containing protein [Nocardiopsis lucentensis]
MSFRIPVRRLFQGGVAFAAVGALGVAIASPAHAENGEVGYARSHNAGEGVITGFYPRGGDVGGYHGPLYGDELFVDSLNSHVVDVVEDELRARVLFRELRVELTEADVEAMRAADEGGVSQPGLEDPEGGGSDDVVLRASYTDTDILVEQNWAGERQYSHTPGTESVEVNELGAQISFSTETSPWHETITEESLRWQEIDPEQELWGGVQTLDLVVSFPDEGFSVSYEVGEVIVASDTAPATTEDGSGDEDTGGEDGQDGGSGEGGSEDGGSEEGGSGEDNPGEGGSGEGDEPASENDRDAAEERPEAESGGPLAQTGSPVAGLVAAGAVISVGGAATVYLTRRRKTASASSEASDES